MACRSCKASRTFENYQKPIPNDCEKIDTKRDGKPVKVMAPLVDRLAWAYERFKRIHRKCGKQGDSK